MLKLLRLIKAVKESESLHLNSPILHHIFNGFVTIRVSASNSYISFDWQSRGDEIESRMLHKNKRALKINLLDCDFQCFFRLFSLFCARFVHAADAPGVSDIEGRITEAGS